MELSGKNKGFSEILFIIINEIFGNFFDYNSFENIFFNKFKNFI